MKNAVILLTVRPNKGQVDFFRQMERENLDLFVLRTLLDWRRAGKATLLATVTRTWGSSPRPVGSIMALCEGGAVVGSVSGGCIEDDLIHRFRDKLEDGPPQKTKYGVSADEAHRFGLPCGGTLELLLEFNPDAATLGDLVQRLSAGRMVQRRTDIATGRVTLTDIDQPDHLPRAHHPAVVGRQRAGDDQQRQGRVRQQCLHAVGHGACPLRRSSSAMASSMLKPWARSSSIGALSSSLLENSRCVAGSRMLRATPSPTGEEM